MNGNSARAVEEYCWPRLMRLIEDPRIWGWLNQPMPQYEVSVEEIVEELEEGSVKDLIREHAVGAQVRLRAAALYASLAESLDKVALDELDVGELLNDASEKLTTYVEISLRSFTRMAKAWAKEQEAHARALFEAMPIYLAEILSAIELLRRERPDLSSIPLSAIPYQPKNYSYLSQCIDKLSRRRDPSRELRQFRDYYKFEFTRTESGWTVTFLTDKPHPGISPLGTLITALAISQFSPISLLPNPEGEVQDEVQGDQSIQSGNGGLSSSGEMGKVGK
jgi:hypothetical protein